MAKKKINIKSVTADVPSGDVNITYKNVRIAGLSESTTAVLETEDTICEDDIEVEYTKPTVGQTVSIPVYRLKVDDNGPIGSPELIRTVTKTVGEYAKESDFLNRADIPTNWELLDKSWAESESFSSNIRRLVITPDYEYNSILVPSIPQTITNADDETRSITIDCFLFRIVAIGR